jgi:transcription antitermination factor NusG
LFTDNDIKKIKQAKDVINQIIPGYKIDLKEHDKPKPYALAYLDRVMFNGAIHKADYADKNSNYPTSAEAIKTLLMELDVDKELEPGAKVKIIAGAFTGMYGTVETLDLPNQKLILNVDLFGQETAVEVELSQIELANN